MLHNITHTNTDGPHILLTELTVTHTGYTFSNIRELRPACVFKSVFYLRECLNSCLNCFIMSPKSGKKQTYKLSHCTHVQGDTHTGHKSLNVVRVEQIRVILFALFTGNNGGGGFFCQVKMGYTNMFVCRGRVCNCARSWFRDTEMLRKATSNQALTKVKCTHIYTFTLAHTNTRTHTPSP